MRLLKCLFCVGVSMAQEPEIRFVREATVIHFFYRDSNSPEKKIVIPRADLLRVEIQSSFTAVGDELQYAYRVVNKGPQGLVLIRITDRSTETVMAQLYSGDPYEKFRFGSPDKWESAGLGWMGSVSENDPGVLSVGGSAGPLTLATAANIPPGLVPTSFTGQAPGIGEVSLPEDPIAQEALDSQMWSNSFRAWVVGPKPQSENSLAGIQRELLLSAGIEEFQSVAADLKAASKEKDPDQLVSRLSGIAVEKNSLVETFIQAMQWRLRRNPQ